MIKPWYKQFWPWFLIALPGTVVVGTLITVYIFSQNSVSLVTEDYYKKGKGINVDLSKIRVAKELGLKATISSSDDAILISLDKGQLEQFPALSVLFAHRTLAEQDFSALLTADANGLYRLQLPKPMQGPWFVEVSPHRQEWLIQGRVNFPSDTPVLLSN